MFESVKARLDKLFRDHSRSDPRAYLAGLREALLEAKTGVSTMKSALAATERELLLERRQLADAERRGRLAAELPDAETVGLAERFAGPPSRPGGGAGAQAGGPARRAGPRGARGRRDARPGPCRPPRTGGRSIAAAWRDLEAAGADRPDAAPEDERLRAETDRKLREQAVRPSSLS